MIFHLDNKSGSNLLSSFTEWNHWCLKALTHPLSQSEDLNPGGWLRTNPFNHRAVLPLPTFCFSNAKLCSGSLCSNNTELCIVPWTLHCSGHCAFVHTISSVSGEGPILSDRQSIFKTSRGVALVRDLPPPRALWPTALSPTDDSCDFACTQATPLSHPGLPSFIRVVHLGRLAQVHSRCAINVSFNGLALLLTQSPITPRMPGQRSSLFYTSHKHSYTNSKKAPPNTTCHSEGKMQNVQNSIHSDN